MKGTHRMLAKAAVLGAAVVVVEAAAIQATVAGASRWASSGEGAAVTRAARVAAGAVARNVSERFEDAMLESARFAARRGAPVGAFALSRDLRHRAELAGLPPGRVVMVHRACVACPQAAAARGLRLRERALREALAKIEGMKSSI